MCEGVRGKGVQTVQKYPPKKDDRIAVYGKLYKKRVLLKTTVLPDTGFLSCLCMTILEDAKNMTEEANLKFFSERCQRAQWLSRMAGAGFESGIRVHCVVQN